MIARVWLILLDILVSVILFFSFILFFLDQPVYILPEKYEIQKQRTSEQIVWSSENNDNMLIPPEDNGTLSMLEEMKTIKLHGNDDSMLVMPKDNSTLSMAEKMNTTEVNESNIMSLEEMIRMSQEISMQEYLNKNDYLCTPLSKRLSAVGAQKGDPVYIRIFKQEAVLEIWIERDGRYMHLKDYPICAYSGHLGPKLKTGDKQSPEGFYRVYQKQLNPHSKFYLAFNLGYPNAYDRAHHRTGSYLMVHGDCRSVGCYAMTNKKIKEIYGLVASALKNGQRYVPVHIFPFRMDDAAMDAHSESRWYDFWMELKEGYDYFEAEEVPPDVKVKNGKYVILDPI